LAPDSVDLGLSYNNLGLLLLRQKKYRDSIDYFGKAINIRREKDPDSPDLAQSYHDMGDAYDGLEDYKTALVYYQHAVQLRERLMPDSLALAHSYNNLASTLQGTAQYAASIPIHHLALAIRIRHAPNSLDLAYSHNNLGVSLWFLEQWESAYDCFAESAHIQATLGHGTANYSITLQNMGKNLDVRGHYEQAIAYLEAAVQHRKWHDQAAAAAADGPINTADGSVVAAVGTTDGGCNNNKKHMSDQVDLLHDLCAAYWHQGYEDKAVACMNRAYLIQRRCDNGGNSYGADDDYDDNDDDDCSFCW
jgi:tetratricopeptide (TPR) repeat protein